MAPTLCKGAHGKMRSPLVLDKVGGQGKLHEQDNMHFDKRIL